MSAVSGLRPRLKDPRDVPSPIDLQRVAELERELVEATQALREIRQERDVLRDLLTLAQEELDALKGRPALVVPDVDDSDIELVDNGSAEPRAFGETILATMPSRPTAARPSEMFSRLTTSAANLGLALPVKTIMLS